MKLKTPPVINKISNVQIVLMATEVLWNNKRFLLVSPPDCGLALKIHRGEFRVCNRGAEVVCGRVLNFFIEPRRREGRKGGERRKKEESFNTQCPVWPMPDNMKLKTPPVINKISKVQIILMAIEPRRREGRKGGERRKKEESFNA